MGHRLAANREERRAYWMLVLPAFSLYLFVMAFPVLLSVALSLSDYDGGRMFGGEGWRITGFSQYAQLFADPFFWNALRNNLSIVGISVFGQIPLGFFFAFLIYRRLVRAPGFWQAVLYMPNIISIIVVGLMWSTIFSPYGPISEIMNGIYRSRFMYAARQAISASGGTLAPTDGLVSRLAELAGPAGARVFGDAAAGIRALLSGYGPDELGRALTELANLFAPRWTAEFMNRRETAMLPVLFVILWMWTGTYVIIFLANMQKIDAQIIEAARIDGASEGQILRFVILPSLSGAIVNAAILAIAGSLNSFALIYAMTGGGPARITEILAIYMYQNAFRARPNYPLANAIALVMVLVSFALIALTKLAEKRFGGKEE